MAVYNGEAWIQAQLSSILAQKNVRLTVIVSDDGSTDHSVAMINQTLSGQVDYSVWTTDSPTRSASRNFFRALVKAELDQFDFVALADQDDIWDLDKLQKATIALQDSGASGYSASTTAFWPNGKSMLLKQNVRKTRADFLFEGAGQGCTFVMRSSAVVQLQSSLKKLGSELNTIHYHDWLIYALYRSSGLEWVFDQRSCMQYRQHMANDTGARTSTSGVGKRLQAIRSGWYGSQVLAITNACIRVDMNSSIPTLCLERLNSAGESRRGRWRLAGFVLLHGRRRLTDRLILLFAGLAGYLSRPQNIHSAGIADTSQPADQRSDATEQKATKSPTIQ